jgi:hypothetical protein
MKYISLREFTISLEKELPIGICSEDKLESVIRELKACLLYVGDKERYSFTFRDREYSFTFAKPARCPDCKTVGDLLSFNRDESKEDCYSVDLVETEVGDIL